MDEKADFDKLKKDARSLRDDVSAFIAPTLAQNQAPSDQQGERPNDDTGEGVASAVDSVVSEALEAPTLAQTKGRTKKETARGARGASSGDQVETDGDGGGGIPPKTLPAQNFFPNDALPVLPLDKKNLKNSRNNYRRTGRVVPRQKRRIRIAPSDLVRFAPNVKSKKMRDLFVLMVENPTMDMPEAMKIVGYHQSVPATSVANSKGWQWLIKFYFPDNELVERERMLLYHHDPKWINASLDRLHKIKGSFNHTQRHEIGPAGAFTEKTDAELMEIVEGEVVSVEDTDNSSSEDSPNPPYNPMNDEVGGDSLPRDDHD